MARDAVHQLPARTSRLTSSGHVGLAEEAEQLPRNRHLMIRNPHDGGGPASACCWSVMPTEAGR
jgi:hypothetical protein